MSEVEAAARKARSEARLIGRSIPVNPYLPVIETAPDARLRNGEIVMRRAMCLFAVSSAALRGSGAAGLEHVERWGLTADLTPAEQSFLRSKPLPERARIASSWRVEALIPLMWATGLLDDMPFPDDQFDFEHLAAFWEDVPAGFWTGVGTKPLDLILDEADFIYRLHWAVRDAGLKGVALPVRVEAGVVMERHHALNWLITHESAEWDEVTTDT